MNLSRSLLLSFCILFISTENLQAQDYFTVTVEFPSQLDLGKIWFYYNNGKESKRLHIKNNRVIITDTLYSRFASIEINYPREDGLYPNHYIGFFVNTKPATINICFNELTSYPLDICGLKNAHNFEQIGRKEYEEFIREEKKDYMDFLTATGGGITGTKDSALLRNEKIIRLLNKEVEFVKNNSHLYYSFWKFRVYLAPNIYLDIDDMIELYESVFSDSLKEGFDGEEISKVLNARSLRKGRQAPDFTAIDINGNTISLEKFRGKYLLLDFWASWCGPCIEELPVIKWIRDNYTVAKLEVISISLDKDTVAFFNAVEKHDMNWIHILNNPEMLKSYGARGIPQVYLIDPNGVIIYSRAAQKDYPHLEKLKKIVLDSL